MKAESSRLMRRFWLIVHYTAFLIFAVAGMIPYQIGGYGGVIILIMIISFYIALWRPGALKFVGKKTVKCDERELQIVNRAFRHSHRVLVGVIGVIVVTAHSLHDGVAAFQDQNIFMYSLTIMTHIALFLPASVIAWTEREIYRD